MSASDVVARQKRQGTTGDNIALHCGRSPIRCDGFLGYAARLGSERAPVEAIMHAWTLGTGRGFAEQVPQNDSSYNINVVTGLAQPVSVWVAGHPDSLWFDGEAYRVGSTRRRGRPAPRILGDWRGQPAPIPCRIRCPRCGLVNRVEPPTG